MSKGLIMRIKKSNKALKKEKDFVINVTVTQQFSTCLDIKASSKEEAMKKAKDMVKDDKINNQWCKGSLASSVSDYWTPEGNVVVTDVVVEEESEDD